MPAKANNTPPKGSPPKHTTSEPKGKAAEVLTAQQGAPGPKDPGGETANEKPTTPSRKEVTVFKIEDPSSDEEEAEENRPPSRQSEETHEPDDNGELAELTELSKSLDNVDWMLTLGKALRHSPLFSNKNPEVNGESASAIVSHEMFTKNRSLEASLETDVFLPRAYHNIGTLPGKEHTRMFEAIGHYVPNLAVRRENSWKRLEPEWILVEAKSSSLRLTSGRAPPTKGWMRYHLVNGKFVEVRAKNAPPFAIFPNLPDFLGFPVRGILTSLTDEELLNVPIGELRSPSELFDEAVEYAGGVAEVKLMPYIRPRRDLLPHSKWVEEWVRLYTIPEPAIRSPPVNSAKEALLQIMAELSEADLPSEMFDMLAELRKMITPQMSEEEAKAIYDATASAFPLDDTPPTSSTLKVKLWAEPDEGEYTEPSPHVPINLDVGGETWSLAAYAEGNREYEIPYPAFLAPEGASTSATNVLSYFPSVQEGIVVNHASYVHSFPWYALSVTPTKAMEGRGILHEGGMWYERMIVHVNFSGPVFSPRLPNDIESQKWSDIFNTTWVEELIDRGHLWAKPRVHLYRGAPRRPNRANFTASARGIGVVGGALTLSPLLQNRDDWEREARQDSRLHFPRNVVRAVIDHPDVFSIVNIEDYLAQRTPLCIRASKNNTVYEGFFRSGTTYRADGETAEQCILQAHGSVTTTEDSAGGGARLPPAPIVPPRSRNVADTVDSDWGIPDDETAPGWRLKPIGVKKPHSEVLSFSDQSVVRKVGNWDTIGEQLRVAGLTDSLIKQYYSVHWEAANTARRHPVVKYHHPAWTESLKGLPSNRKRWYWPTGAIAPCPWLSTNDAGQTPLFGLEAEQHLNKITRKAGNQQFWAAKLQNNKSVGDAGESASRHVPTRGRGGKTRSSRAPREGTTLQQREGDHSDLLSSSWW